MLFATELQAGTAYNNYKIYPSYDSCSWCMGDVIIPYSGSNPTDTYISPLKVGVARPMEQSTSIASAYPWALQYITASVGNAGKDWVFLADNASAVNNRRVHMYEYDRQSSAFTWKGFVIINFPTAAATHTIQGFRMSRHLYSSGTVNVIGNVVTGSSVAQWQTSQFAGGARIGFGDIDPTHVIPSNWYDIGVINNNTLLTLSSSAGVWASGTQYVIDELRAHVATVATPATSGGLFTTKGLSYNTFIPGGWNIHTSSLDNVRATYWLSDVALNGPNAGLNTSSCGLALETCSADFQTHNVYVLNRGATVSAQFFKFNLRTQLTGSITAVPVIGRTTASFAYSSSIVTTTGTISNTNNSRLGILAHGPAANTQAIYFATTTRLYCCPLNEITASSTSFLKYMMVEIPPGTVNAYPAGSVMASCEIGEKTDKLFVTSTGATSNRCYVTTFDTQGGATFSNIFLCDNKQLDQQVATTAGVPPFPTNNILPFSVWTEGGLVYLCRNSAAIATNQLYALSLSAHYEYTATSNEVLITPQIQTPSATKYYRVYVNTLKQYGTVDAFSHSPEAYKLYVRTSNISDNSGAWTLVDDAGTLTGIAAAPYIQFKMEFKTLGLTTLPNRFYGLVVLYEAGGYLPSQLQWRLSDSNTTDGTIGFSQVSLFGGTVPSMQIDYYRSDNQANVLTQASTSTTYGVFEYWTGAAWTAGLGTDVVGTRRRFRPTAGLPTGVDVYAKVSTI